MGFFERQHTGKTHGPQGCAVAGAQGWVTPSRGAARGWKVTQ